MPASTTPLRSSLTTGRSGSAVLQLPSDASAAFVFAHGAGAGMNHPFMADLSAALSDRRIATLRYQFSYMEEARTRPDAPAMAHAVVQTTNRKTAARLPGLRLFAC